MDNIKKRIFFIFTALLINISVFAAIPRLSTCKSSHESRSEYSPVLIADYKPLPHPVKHRQQPEPPEPFQEKLIKKIQKPVIKPEKISPRKPAMNIKIPDADFEINPLLATAMSIDPPPPEPAAEILEPAPVVLPAAAIPSEFSMAEVDQVPGLIKKVEPKYPYNAKRRNINGSVTVKFLVSAAGYVEKTNILSADPKGIFEKNVLQAIKKWKFKPGIRKGQAVPTWVIVPIQFTLDR
ncbi:TonB family C-terminal domain-containing protein [Desulfonema limicola]|uniref:Protein TonB n=1 Tax=Desulfonema limicola TaxID=45656 RepID=A0A975BER2_9BACT|nr:energy transducer TonB [Desulfonema limicola]QTA83755.1 TonB family C-terminal domain-containing protein [Desulfonema limicola]